MQGSGDGGGGVKGRETESPACPELFSGAGRGETESGGDGVGWRILAAVGRLDRRCAETRTSGADAAPDVRDGLTRLERIILIELDRARRELRRESVPTALLYGRVVERVDVGVDEFQAALARLAGRPALR